jgi:ABC-type transport system involved in multi-copper enzyme maturation permease subunit
MKNALVIAAREFEEKRFIAYAAVAFAILPFVLSVIPGIHGKSPEETIALSSLIFATGFGVALAVLTGVSFVGRDLSDGRMSFYFSRPVASSSIWFGKLTAGILMVVGCFAVIIAPAWLAAGRNWTTFSTMSLGAASVTILTWALALFLIAHVIGTFARSQSPWIAIDFAAAVVCGVAIRYLVLPLAAGQASVLISKLSIWLAVALVVAIVGGGMWQLEHGRTDRRRNHLALSQFLWATMAVALLIAAAFVAWVVSVRPEDLTSSVFASRSPAGSFMTVAGKTRGRDDYTAAWLMNTEDGRNIRIDARSAWGVQYTRDGRTVFWPVVERNVAELRRYTSGEREPIDTGLTVWGDFIIPSDDGSRIATVSHGILSIYDVAQKRSLVSARVPWEGMVRGCFVSPDRFRLYAQTSSALQIFELDASTRALSATGSIVSKPFVFVSLDPTASRMVVRLGRSGALTLNDARTGALIKTLYNGSNGTIELCLRDGRIAIVEMQPGISVLHLFAPDGSSLRDIPLDAKNYTSFAGDDGTRVIIVASIGSARALVAVNLDRGLIERQETDVREWIGSNWLDVRQPVPPLREVIYKDAQKHIMGWNPATGAKRRIT